MPPFSESLDGTTTLKLGRGGFGSAKWWNFMPTAIKALHIDAFMNSVQRAKVMLMIRGVEGSRSWHLPLERVMGGVYETRYREREKEPRIDKG